MPVDHLLHRLEVALRLLLVLVGERLVEVLVHLEVHVHRDVDGLDLAFGLDLDAAAGGERRGGDDDRCLHFSFLLVRFMPVSTSRSKSPWKVTSSTTGTVTEPSVAVPSSFSWSAESSLSAPRRSSTFSTL